MDSSKIKIEPNEIIHIYLANYEENNKNGCKQKQLSVTDYPNLCRICLQGASDLELIEEVTLEGNYSLSTFLNDFFELDVRIFTKRTCNSNIINIPDDQ